MKKSLLFSILIAFLFVNYSWCQTDKINDTKDKWSKWGDHPDDYNMGGDPFSISDAQAGFVKSIGDNPEGFGSWMTSIKPDKYLGKRLKLSMNLKSVDVDNWSSMWMRVDGEDRILLSFDNMQNRALKGSNDWGMHDIVLDVPENSIDILYGVLLAGKGQIWAKDLHLQIVDESVEITDINQFYNYLYSGNYKKAIPTLEKYIKGANTDLYYSVYYYVALMETNQKDRAKKFIKNLDRKQLNDDWVCKIISFLNNKLKEKELLIESFNQDAKIDSEQLCEAFFYIGMVHKFNNNLEKAKECFEKSIATNEKDFVEYNLSKSELAIK